MIQTLFVAAICAVSIPSIALAENIPLVPIPTNQEMKAFTSGLTLDAAIQRALNNSPRLKSSDTAKLSSRGAHTQAGLLPNPELSIDAEDVGGDGPYKNFDSAQVTYGVSQLIELGGKRDARVAYAKGGIDLADHDYQATRLDLIKDVTHAFTEAVAAGEQVKQAQEQKELAEDVLQTVTRRVNAAREPLIQKSKANVAFATSRIGLEKAERAYSSAKKVLANLMNEDVAINTLNTSAFYNIAVPATVADIRQALSRNPDVARWKPTIAREEAALDLEKANAIPDPRLTAGFRQYRETDNNAFVVGLSIPIPVFNQNEGNIAKAGAEVNKAFHDQRVNEITLSSDLTKSLEMQQTAYAQATTLKASILPEAENAFSLSKNGYQAGKFAYLEVLDAERTLADVRLQYIEAIKEYHIQRANVERLTAAHLQISTAPEENHE